MICAKCQASNPDGAKFCMSCGSGLALSCTGCGTELQAGAKFCVNCGQPVGEPAPSSENAGASTPCTF